MGLRSTRERPNNGRSHGVATRKPSVRQPKEGRGQHDTPLLPSPSPTAPRHVLRLLDNVPGELARLVVVSRHGNNLLREQFSGEEEGKGISYRCKTRQKKRGMVHCSSWQLLPVPICLDLWTFRYLFSPSLSHSPDFCRGFFLKAEKER